MTRLIDADKLPVIRTFALVNDEKTEGSFAFAPIYCVIKGDLGNAPTVTIAEWKAEMPSYIKEAMLDALRPNGEWTQEDHTDEMLNIWHCSNCKEDFCSEVGGHPKEWNYNFCPNCGAKMQNGGATDEP